MTKFVITETLLSSVIFKTIMVSLHRGRFVVVHLYSSFSIDPEFLIRGKFVPKNTILKATTVKFGTRLRSWDSLPNTKFCKKNRLRGYTHLGKIYTKNYQSSRFRGL